MDNNFSPRPTTARQRRLAARAAKQRKIILAITVCFALILLMFFILIIGNIISLFADGQENIPDEPQSQDPVQDDPEPTPEVPEDPNTTYVAISQEATHKGNLILDDIYGADVRFMDTDSYDDIYAEMHIVAEELAKDGHKSYFIPCGGSNALGALGYVNCVREFTEQAEAAGVRIGHIVSATGSGGTTAGLLLGAKLYLPGVKVTGMGVDDDPFEEIVPALAAQSAAILEGELVRSDDDFQMVYNLGAGYAIPNAEDTPYIEELARLEGILLDPVYTGKAWSGMLKLLKDGYFGDQDNLVFVHTGGAAALFAMDLPHTESN